MECFSPSMAYLEAKLLRRQSSERERCCGWVTAAYSGTMERELLLSGSQCCRLNRLSQNLASGAEKWRVHLRLSPRHGVRYHVPLHRVCVPNLPNRLRQFRYELVPHLQPADYMQRLQQGWRRFGWAMYRPECPSRRKCRKCHCCCARGDGGACYDPASMKTTAQREHWNGNPAPLETVWTLSKRGRRA
jgi:hypothetical protein